MKKAIKPFLLGAVLGGIIGGWFGMNAGKDQPLWSNPLAEVGVGEQLRRAGSNALEEGGEALNRQGERLQEKLDQ